MTEKYARMENQIPPLKESQDIDDIVAIEVNWLMELIDKYPRTIQGSGESFRTYASCELETLSDETLKLLHEMAGQAVAENRKRVEERYNHLFQSMGYESLADKELRTPEVNS
jgi:hypothetical protein